MQTRIIVCLLLVCMTACSNEIKQPFSLNDLYHADPKADAEAAIKKGNLHIYALYGHNPYTPEIKRGCVSDESIIPIKGTSDAFENYEHAQFNVLAQLYAKYYNFQIKAHLIRQGDTCLSW